MTDCLCDVPILVLYDTRLTMVTGELHCQSFKVWLLVVQYFSAQWKLDHPSRLNASAMISHQLSVSAQ